jgi:hypothetical protein
MATKGQFGIGACEHHGEYHKDAEDSPCTTCGEEGETTSLFCMFCDIPAIFTIDNDTQCKSPAPLCGTCQEAYAYGQCSPDATFTEFTATNP